MSLNNQAKDAADLIKNSKSVYVLTGAGISTESGIQDFRTPGKGLWEKIDPIKESTVDVLMTNPKRFYSIAFKRYASLKDKEPNIGHKVIAKMEEEGYVKGLITQNIDNLHYKAGSKNMWEVHGHIRTCRCTQCHKGFDFNVITDQLESGKEIPLCPACESLLRPDIVLFGDQMPNDFFKAAQALENESDLLIVVGSSLAVYPVASLPELTNKLIIINYENTPFDTKADIIMNYGSGEALSKIYDFLE